MSKRPEWKWDDWGRGYGAWIFVWRRKGYGRVYSTKLGGYCSPEQVARGENYIWEVWVRPQEKGALWGGYASTLEEAKEKAEEYLDLIDEYE